MVLVLLALALPPERIGRWLARSGSDLVGSITAGMWIFRIMLLVHAGWWAAAVRWPRIPGTGSLLSLPADREGERGGWRLIGSIMLLALVVRLIDLGDGLWYDEIQTAVRYAHLALPRLMATFDSQNQHMLYSILVRVSVGILGDHPWAMRLPAVLLGVASIWATYVFALRVTGRREALLAAGFLALSYHHVWFSQNARGYTGLLLWTLLSTGAFLDLLTNRTPGRWRPIVVYAVVMAAGVYTQVTAAFVTGAHLLVWTWLAWRRPEARGYARWAPGVAIALAITLTLQVLAPALPQFFTTLLTPTMGGVATQWKNPMWFVVEMLTGLADGVPGGLVGVAGGGVVLTAGTISYLRRTPVVGVLMLLPGLLLAGALAVLEHNLWPRLFLFSAGFAALLLMRGLSVTAGRWSRHGAQVTTVVGMALILGSGWSVRHAWNPKQDYVGARDFVAARAQANDAVVTVDMTELPFVAYLGEDWPPVLDVNELAQVEAAHDRTWILVTFPTRLSAVHPQLWDRLQREYREVGSFPGTVAGGAVLVMRKG